MSESCGQGQEPRTRWGLLIGCLGAGCIVLVLAAAGVVAAGVFGFFSLLKGSGAYELALERIQESTTVADAIGRPVEPGWWVMGHLRYSDGSGSAGLTIPLRGPKGKATAYAEAARKRSQWHLLSLRVVIRETGETIELVEPSGTEDMRAPPV
jgi:hypothetical protein